MDDARGTTTYLSQYWGEPRDVSCEMYFRALLGGERSGAVFPINQGEQLGTGQLTCAAVHRRSVTFYSPVQPQPIILGGRPASSRHASSHANAASRPSGLASRNALKCSIAAPRSCSLAAGESGK